MTTNTTNLSRRSALAGFAGAAVAGVSPAVAVAGDDAELLALKPKFDPLFAKWVAMMVGQDDEDKAFVGPYERKTGLKWDNRPTTDWKDPAWVACWQATQECHEMLRSDDPNAWDKLRAEINPLADEILSYNARTLDGLRLQLRALISAYDETWNPSGYDEDDVEHPATRCFIKSTAGVLGLPFPPY